MSEDAKEILHTMLIFALIVCAYLALNMFINYAVESSRTKTESSPTYGIIEINELA
jgi:hypothetical protein